MNIGRRSRTKGQVFERKVAAAFQAKFPLADAHRGLQAAGERVPDVDGIPSLWIECKHGKKPNLRGALKQAEEACRERTPVAVVQDDYDRMGPYVLLRLDAFLKLLRGDL